MAPTLTVRAWNPHDGNPGSPEHVLGIPVDRLLAKRPDAPGALVALRDRRLALTGQVAAIGRHRVLRTYVRGRARPRTTAPTAPGWPRWPRCSSGCCRSRARVERRGLERRRGLAAPLGRGPGGGGLAGQIAE